MGVILITSERQRQSARKYYAKNKHAIYKKHKDYMREWAKRPENREKQLAYMKERQRDIRDVFEKYKKTVVCSICGVGGHPAIIDFHHINGSGGRDNMVARLVSAGSRWDRIKEEIEKCTPLCSNCHRKIHYDKHHAPHN